MASADAILVIHFIYVLGVILPVPIILWGAWAGWEFIRNNAFRGIHLGMCAIVAAEAILGIVCPLTVWEEHLRERAGQLAYQGSFIAHWMERIVYHDWPLWVFTTIYVAFTLLVVILYFVIPPRWLQKKRG